jgi:hypothetical protein
MDSKLLGYCWFTGMNCIGVVLIETAYSKEIKAYIGSGAGLDEKLDIEHIIDWGASFPVEEAISIIEKFGSKLT